ncbi:MAG: amidohydrolase family protein [Gemmatimonadetes bacterium]|nr:amidohydrolase [Gemmatimonadota bacterium]NIQ55449.1 amidohydrolase [Gemmatimonadota bacterium]NIU75657.1 amidohydrolase family protein [Gammaproteobacteria bacterium]NIX45332.1 amidohydrolase family protein [Gemmatimonadota bacterium]NIY09615.1 amidohydrolase family protein [Gemmatimonadota bacterium]
MLLLRNALLDGRRADIRIRDGVIAGVEPHDPAAPAEADRVIEAAGLHAFPSLRNGHTHAAMTLFRGWGDDLPLMEWLRTHIWPAEERMTADDVYHGTRLALVEMIRSGTTYFNDMYWHADAVARAVDELGLRAHIGSVFIDHGDDDTARRWREDVLRRVEERDALGPRMQVALAPHAIYTVSPENLEWLGGLARDHDLLLHIHLSETRDEVEQCVAAHGVRPAHLLERVGLLGPNLIAAHGVYLDAEEMALLGEAGATIVTNPTANLKLAVGGIFDYDAAKAAGVRVVLGTDGAGSNNNLDLLEEMKIAALVQKHRAGDATSLPAHEALALATTAPAEAFRLGSGRIEAGQPADLILVDLSGPSTQPAHDPVSDLVYAANGRAVHTTICDGRVLMHDRALEVADEAEVVREAVRAARSLVERVEG